MESLVPAHCEEGSIDHFFEMVMKLNRQMVQRLEAAREMGAGATLCSAFF